MSRVVLDTKTPSKYEKSQVETRDALKFADIFGGFCAFNYAVKKQPHQSRRPFT